MKHLLCLFSFIALSYTFVSCSNDDNADWMYGNQQELANTEWESTKVYYGGTQGRSVTNIPELAETLRFDSNSFTLTDTRMNYETEKTYTVQATGKYEYNHPKLKLIFDDGSVLEAHISAQNTIYYNDKEMGYNEFERK